MAKICKKIVKDSSVEFHFINGTEITVEIDKMTKPMLDRLLLHGIAQKVGDSYAGALSVEEAITNCQNVIDQLYNDTWTTKRQSTSIWIDALMRVLQIDHSEALEQWNDLSDDQRKEMQKHPQLKAAKMAIDAERLQEKMTQMDSIETTPLSELFK